MTNFIWEDTKTPKLNIVFVDNFHHRLAETTVRFLRSPFHNIMQAAAWVHFFRWRLRSSWMLMMGGKVPTGACLWTFLLNSGACAPCNQYFFFQDSWKTEIISYFFLDTSGRASNLTNEAWRYSLAKPCHHTIHLITLWAHGAQTWATGGRLRYNSDDHCGISHPAPHYYCQTALYQANSTLNKNNFQKWRWNTNFQTRGEIIYCQSTSTIKYIEGNYSEWRI